MSKSSAARIRSSKLLAACCLLLPAAVFAWNGLSTDDAQLVQQGAAIREAAQSESLLDMVNNPHLESARQEAQQLLRELQTSDPTLQRLQAAQKQQSFYAQLKLLVFASRSLGEQGLDDLLTSVAGHPEAVVVFRGVPEGERFADGVLAIQSLAKSKEPVPNIVIDPTLFQAHSVKAVPTIVMLEEATQQGEEPRVLARVEGLSDVAWLLREIEQGRQGDRGVRGPLAEISEPDLIEVMKAKAAQIDWDEKKEQAKARFWHNQQFHELPRAPQARTRVLDPSILVTSDIRAADGTLIAAEGTAINPLELRNFTQAVVVFDPLDKTQLELLTEELPVIRRQPGVGRITFIVTRLDRDDGWESYEAITDTLDAPVFLLTPDLRERFALEYTPTVITAQDKRFVVRELARGEEE